MIQPILQKKNLRRREVNTLPKVTPLGGGRARNHRGRVVFRLPCCTLGWEGRAHDRVVPKQQPWVYNDEDKKMKITKPHSPNAQSSLWRRHRCVTGAWHITGTQKWWLLFLHPQTFTVHARLNANCQGHRISKRAAAETDGYK